MRLNTPPAPTRFTHQGAPAKRISDMQALRRSVASCFLWEKEFYENGQSIATRIAELAKTVPAGDLADLAIETRHVAKLRHVPLLMLSVLAQRGSTEKVEPGLVARTIEAVISRPDEMGEFLAIHAVMNGVGPDALKRVIPAQVKKGLARAFGKFDAYQLAKYNRPGAVTLVDVMRLVHPRPADEDREAVLRDLRAGTLAAPDTWEVALSGGADKRETFERLLTERKLGYMALLRNLRNMDKAGVDDALIQDAILARRGAGNVLPFRYTAAARACPRFEPVLDQALSEAILEQPVMDGKTIILVDVSGSMGRQLSQKSDLTRMDAAATLAAIFHGECRLFTFSEKVEEVPPRRGMAGVDAIIRSQPHIGTRLGDAVRKVAGLPHDRLIVITDEQSSQPVPDPSVRDAYMINVASARHGVGYGTWRHIDGFSENVLRFIREIETLEA